MNWLAAAPWILSAILAVGGFTAYEIERGNYLTEKAAYADYKTAEAKAVLEAQQKADSLSNELIIAQAASMAVTEKTVTTYVDRIIHDPPSACPPSGAARDGSRAVRDILSGAGQPAAQ